MTLAPTASQTLGPFFNYALPLNADLTGGGKAQGCRIVLRGRVTDVDAAPVRDALVEIWQANAAGGYDHPLDRDEVRARDPHFIGFGRTLTDAEGAFSFTTVMPGPVPFEGNCWQAPHISVAVFAAGLLRRVRTRAYFPGEAMNEDDPVLAAVPKERRELLVAAAEGEGSYRFDIRLRGDNETPFFGD
ncbi:MAG: protocatechuate 3,4-dioxygenase subunit alpha [Alphaproteobacteria bacterium]|nr:protocatechuate 3,4-dioxygenase subunit alpha [Alphaproteobacteria bacterium]MCY4229482.1 protocatechuate 3,4-dioxygenase subunit alpha [Alphaproteobacteria bacterium]MCY4320087.1 protocatechuate 3,4-dioxygenase subunit alpha [Alphaproteobacteria bacterium]